MTDRLVALRLFARVARSGNFSRAGRELGFSQPSASRIVSELEREVGVALLTRTTRAVTLTEAGVDYLARIEAILDALDEADHAVRGSGELRGVLRVGVAASFGVRELIPRLPAFTERHPALRIELLMNDQRQDLVHEGVDIALRFGELADSVATARRLGATRRMLVASPAYLARAGTPQQPDELAAHRFIGGPVGPGARGIPMALDGRALVVRVQSRLVTTVNEGATAAAVAGMGIAMGGHWGCRAELDDGRLQQVLPAWDLGSTELHAVFPAGRAAKPAARALGEFIAAGLAEAGPS
jgi:DNA-binding transcriptional LysR family regulator